MVGRTSPRTDSSRRLRGLRAASRAASWGRRRLTRWRFGRSDFRSRSAGACRRNDCYGTVLFFVLAQRLGEQLGQELGVGGRHRSVSVNRHRRGRVSTGRTVLAELQKELERVLRDLKVVDVERWCEWSPALTIAPRHSGPPGSSH